MAQSSPRGGLWGGGRHHLLPHSHTSHPPGSAARARRSRRAGPWEAGGREGCKGCWRPELSEPVGGRSAWGELVKPQRLSTQHPASTAQSGELRGRPVTLSPLGSPGLGATPHSLHAPAAPLTWRLMINFSSCHEAKVPQDADGEAAPRLIQLLLLLGKPRPRPGWRSEVPAWAWWGHGGGRGGWNHSLLSPPGPLTPPPDDTR